jgi:tyrosine-protein kinase
MATSDYSSYDDTVWLGEYLGVLRRYKWSILALIIIGAVGGYLFSALQNPVYDSTSRVLATVPFVAGGQSLSPNMETESAFVTSDDVTKCASLIMADSQFREDPTGGPGTAVDQLCSDDALDKATLDRSLSQDVTVTIVPQSSVMTVTFEAGSPQRAQAGAQAFALAYVQERTSEAQVQLDQARKPLLDNQASLQKDIDSLNSKITKAIDKQAKAQQDAIDAGQPPPPSNLAEILNLENQRNAKQSELTDINNQLRTLDPSKLNPPQVILPAGLPTKSVNYSPILLAVLGGLIGLVLGVALAFIRNRLDDSLRSKSDVENLLGTPVLGVIPKVPGWRRKGEVRLVTRDQPKSAAAESYRTLRTSVAFACTQRGMKVIMVCSASPGEGKTTTSANLAMAFADAGRRAVVVSADLRKPRLHRFFGVDNESGLVSVLSGEKQPWEVILDPNIPNLRLVPSGPVPGKPAELLQSERMAEMLNSLREVSDYVILDTTPMLPVSDALALAPLVDGVLFVADAQSTSRASLGAAREQLDQVGAFMFGAVLNNLDAKRARSYRYRAYSPGSAYRYAQYGAHAYGPPASENGDARGARPTLELPQDRRNP